MITPATIATFWRISLPAISRQGPTAAVETVLPCFSGLIEGPSATTCRGPVWVPNVSCVIGASSIEPDARIEQRKQQVRQEHADEGERREQQDEAAGEIHVLRDQRAEEQGTCGRQVQDDGG